MNEQLKNILPDNRIEELLSIGREKSIVSSDYFIRAGETPIKIAYVFKGLFRYVYFNDNGDEFTKAILSEDNFISSYSAMVLSKPSYFSIEALENSHLLEITWSDFNQLKENDVFWVKFLIGAVAVWWQGWSDLAGNKAKHDLFFCLFYVAHT